MFNCTPAVPIFILAHLFAVREQRTKNKVKKSVVGMLYGSNCEFRRQTTATDGHFDANQGAAKLEANLTTTWTEISRFKSHYASEIISIEADSFRLKEATEKNLERKKTRSKSTKKSTEKNGK